MISEEHSKSVSANIGDTATKNHSTISHESCSSKAQSRREDQLRQMRKLLTSY